MDNNFLKSFPDIVIYCFAIVVGIFFTATMSLYVYHMTDILYKPSLVEYGLSLIISSILWAIFIAKNK